MTTPRTVVDESLPITRIVVTGDLNTERVVVDVEDQPRIAVSNTGEDITVNVYSTAAGVNSVNGLQGDVTLSTTNVAEGTNLYYTTARVNSAFDTRLATKTTSDVAEGSNQYFTTARARSAISAGNNITITNGVISTVTEPDFTTATVTEAPTDNYHVTNKEYVDSQVSGVAVPISTDDLPEGSVNEYYTDARSRAAISAGGNLSYNSSTGVISYTTPTTIASLSNHTTTDLAEGTNLYYTDARVATKVESYGYATEGYVGTQIANLVDSSPATLDTLNELAAALGDDPNFATTVSTALGTKLATADFTSTANTWLGTKSTTNLAEGTNLYYTSTRANSDFDTRLATKNTDAIAEGSTNLYYTDARVTSRINSTSIDALSDVVITSAASGQMLYHNGTNWVNSAAVDSPNLSRFIRTAAGTGNNTIVALSRNRADAARGTDFGPWLGFEYVGTDNTQATSPQSAIRSMYDPAGNHKLQVMQLPGNYTSPVPVAQFQRGNTFINNTSGGNMLLLNDSSAIIRGTTTTITNSGNTTTYATFASTGTSILGAGLHTLTRTTVGTPGVTESRPSFNIQLTRTDQATPSNNDGTGFRYRVAGSNATAYTLADMTATYATNGDAAWFLNLANGDQTGSTFTGVGIIQSKVSSTTIRAGTPSATPGASTVNDVVVFSDAKILNKRPHRSDVTTATVARGSTYTPAAGVNNFIELTLTAGTDPTYIDVDNLTVSGEGGHQAILVYNNSGSSVGNGDLIIRNNGNTINDLQDTITNGARVIFTVYCVGNYASCEYMIAG